MKIVIGTPPNYEDICRTFNVRSDAHVVFTYGDTLYNPGGGEISLDLLTHEQTHTAQQGDEPDRWWMQYLIDPMFRLDQEVEAYRAQYIYAMAHYSRSQRRSLLKHISKSLAGVMYGNIVTKEQAKVLITEST